MAANWNPEQVEHIATQVVDAALRIHKAIGPGLLESVYVKILVRELQKRGFKVTTEAPVHVLWDGEDLGVGYRVDILVDDAVVLEIKSTEASPKVHGKQALTYLRLMDLPLGFVLNFAQPLMKDGIQRVANDYYGKEAQ